MARVRVQRQLDIWPGFVDALSSLILVMIFMLVAYMLGHFFLAQQVSGRDQALQRLNARIAELGDLLNMERKAGADTRASVAQLTATLQTVNQDRDQLNLRLRDAQLRATAAEQALIDAQRTVTENKDVITARLADIERLNRDIAALKQVRADLEDQVAGLKLAIDNAGVQTDRAAVQVTQAQQLAAQRDTALQAALAELNPLRDRSKELETRLATEAERTALAQKDVKDRDVKLTELQDLYNRTTDELEAAKKGLSQKTNEADQQIKLTGEAQAQVALLNQQLAALRAQLAQIAAALDAAEAKDKDQVVQIADLGQRLNVALAQKVEELSLYRSEFFGRLREVLGDRADVRVVGDRFVFQSEVLFAVGQDELGDEGKAQPAKFAQTLLQISRGIPREVNWVLQVNGHTDKRPINTVRFPSNWELSTARALSVVKFLVSQGVPSDRLAATGFAEFQPIDTGEDEIAFRRNRRIELKLTER